MTGCTTLRQGTDPTVDGVLLPMARQHLCAPAAWIAWRQAEAAWFAASGARHPAQGVAFSWSGPRLEWYDRPEMTQKAAPHLLDAADLLLNAEKAREQSFWDAVDTGDIELYGRRNAVDVRPTMIAPFAMASLQIQGSNMRGHGVDYFLVRAIDRRGVTAEAAIFAYGPPDLVARADMIEQEFGGPNAEAQASEVNIRRYVDSCGNHEYAWAAALSGARAEYSAIIAELTQRRDDLLRAGKLTPTGGDQLLIPAAPNPTISKIRP